MNAEEFIQYAVLFAIVIAGGAYILWDAWRDRAASRRDAARAAAERCCPAGYGCEKCYYGRGK